MKKLNARERQAQDIIFKEVVKAVNLLHDHLKKFCEQNQAQAVPKIYIDYSVKMLLEGYKKGVDDTRKDSVPAG